MIKLSVIGVILFFSIAVSAQSAKSPISELKQIGQQMQQHSFVKYAYEIDHHRSYSDQAAPTKGVICFTDNKSDTIIGMKFRTDQKWEAQSYEQIYDGRFIYSLIKADSAVIKAPLINFENGHGTEYPVLELSYCAIKLFLTNPNLESEVSSLVKKDTIVNAQSCISYSFICNEQFVSTHKQFAKNNTAIELIVSKADLLPVYYSNKTSFKSGNKIETNFDEVKFFAYSFDDTSYPDSFFESESIPSYYDWTKWKFLNKTLALNTSAPQWTLPLLTGDSVSLNDYKGKYVLLDFWYIGCGSCIKSIPQLNALHTKYQNSGLNVLGVNCLTNNKDKIKRYCEIQNMKYPNVWNGEELSKSYRINAAPIFYLINPQGTIVYTQYGYSDHLIENVDEIIRKMPLTR
nr:TlpA disulfide reductase family protein [uncultured Carboxylicivirga sp.]